MAFFSPDGEYILTVGWYSTIRLWEAFPRYVEHKWSLNPEDLVQTDISNVLLQGTKLEISELGDMLFDNDELIKAQLFYKKAQAIGHSPHALLQLNKIAEKTGQKFDFQQFLESKNLADFRLYGDYFIQKAEMLEPYREKIPSYKFALLLREKQLTLDTSAVTRIEVANEYNSLGFYQLFLPDGAAAEASLRRAYELDSANKFIPSNLAPALLLQGRWPEAEAEYRKWKDLEFDENVFSTYREAFLEDLSELERQGVTHPDFARARTLLQQK